MKKVIKVICHHEYGVPEEVARVESRELPAIAADQVLVEMKAPLLIPLTSTDLRGSIRFAHLYRRLPETKVPVSSRKPGVLSLTYV